MVSDSDSESLVNLRDDPLNYRLLSDSALKYLHRG